MTFLDPPSCGLLGQLQDVLETHGFLCCGFPLLVFFVIGGVDAWLRAKQDESRWRSPDKLCMKCGYDLRATPDRCPECGTPVEKSK